MLIVDFNVSVYLFLKVQAKGSHLLISSSHSNRIHQKPFSIGGNKFICLSQVAP
uniref:Uncharacterized protein n=1 Tax=Rhizophora mucronata TaxID=61149 RepID=A0A2P2PT82_RHIMU